MYLQSLEKGIPKIESNLIQISFTRIYYSTGQAVLLIISLILMGQAKSLWPNGLIHIKNRV